MSGMDRLQAMMAADREMIGARSTYGSALVKRLLATRADHVSHEDVISIVNDERALFESMLIRIVFNIGYADAKQEQGA